MSADDRIAESVKLGKPAHRALAQAGIVTFADLARWRREDVAALHGVGAKALSALAPAMAARGVAFKP
jgi:hypothetical protein